MTDPFRIEGPALISFSGGRTSAYMLWRVLQAWGGTLPNDVKVTFANTGKEMPETLDFVRDCGERWSVEIHWLEYRRLSDGPSFVEVDYLSASRDGEPFKALMDSRQYLPNPVTRFCTVELKIRTMARWGKTQGYEEFDKVVGLRADEMHRVHRARARARAVSSAETGERDILLPLADAGVTKRDVQDFWRLQNWGLNLPTINGTTPLGNCDLCFLKSASTIMGIIRDRPELAVWWAEAEAEARSSKPDGALFRKDRPSYATMIAAVKAQHNFDFGNADERQDCFCAGDS